MSPGSIIVLATVTVTAFVWLQVRRTATRRRCCRDQLTATLRQRRPDLTLFEIEPGAVRHTPLESADLPMTYLVDGEPRPAYLTDEHLAQAGIDARDSHGVALAVLRQRFDERAARAALDSAEAVLIEPADGCGGSRLLLLSEILRQDEVLFASAPAPGRLFVAADRGTLDAALAKMAEPMEPLPPAVFRVTAGGLRTES